MKRETIGSKARTSPATRRVKRERKDISDVEAANEQTSSPPDELQAIIAQAAYYRAAQRGFEPGYELDDWLAAEREISSPRSTALRQSRSGIG